MQELKKLLKGNRLSKDIEFVDDFLQAYLIFTKYEEKKAFNRLRSYLNLRTNHSYIFQSVPFDIASHPSCRFATFLPRRLPNGSIIVLLEPGNWNPDELPFETMKQILCMIFLQELRNPVSQASGFHLIQDFSNTGTRYLKFCTPYNMYLLNHVTFIYIHSSPVELLNHFPGSHLPTKYGGALTNYCMSDYLKKANEQHSNFPIGGQKNIPELGYYASDSKTEVVKALRKLYIGNNIPDKFWNIKSGLLNTNNDFKTIYVLDTRRDVYVTCYAHNLHLNTSSAPETMSPNVKFPGEFIHVFKIDVNKSETIYLWKIPQIFLAIHSPFVPVHPLWEGIPLKPGHNYIINLRLEEEYLLPYPYHTNCTDYDALWRSNNKAGPRSQEMCKHWCAWTLPKACYTLAPSIKMLEKPIRFCEDNEFGNSEVDINLLVHKSKCNPECKMEGLFLDNVRVSLCPNTPVGNDTSSSEKSDEIVVELRVPDPEVIVTSHEPVYRIVVSFKTTHLSYKCDNSAELKLLYHSISDRRS
ncbi:Retinaldehyde-binding protein 1 like protein [Argiope bruennichi]|uniref:Retinaldehyde-binding protein 1 like protein n=1 Tax=Argiope bruennichi TaxID=94029 RepID=A0A8T0ERU5_ARGBR|nr:Retinaldehyde-binding protein 1 like protein [Argiope bruennichi]